MSQQSLFISLSSQTHAHRLILNSQTHISTIPNPLCSLPYSPPPLKTNSLTMSHTFVHPSQNNASHHLSLHSLCFLTLTKSLPFPKQCQHPLHYKLYKPSPHLPSSLSFLTSSPSPHLPSSLSFLTSSHHLPNPLIYPPPFLTHPASRNASSHQSNSRTTTVTTTDTTTTTTITTTTTRPVRLGWWQRERERERERE